MAGEGQDARLQRTTGLEISGMAKAGMKSCNATWDRMHNHMRLLKARFRSVKKQRRATTEGVYQLGCDGLKRICG